GRIEHGAEEFELLAQDLEREPLGLVVSGQEIDDRHRVVLLLVAVTAADALLDALRVPRKIVVYDRVAELQVETLRSGLRRDEQAGPSLKRSEEHTSELQSL